MKDGVIRAVQMILALLTGLQNLLAVLLDEEDAVSGRFRRRSSEGSLPCRWCSRTQRCRSPPTIPFQGGRVPDTAWGSGLELWPGEPAEKIFRKGLKTCIRAEGIAGKRGEGSGRGVEGVKAWKAG